MRFESNCPRPPTDHEVRDALNLFIRVGCSIHAPDGVVLAPLLTALEQAAIPYTLVNRPGVGYTLLRGDRTQSPDPFVREHDDEPSFEPPHHGHPSSASLILAHQRHNHALTF